MIALSEIRQKRTQNTFLYSVKASVYNGFQREATFYYPNWNADLPMPLYTFLETYDFSGKTVILFTTHGGSGFSRTIQTISELQPDATVISDGLSISRNSVSGAESEVVDWVNGLDLSARIN